MTTQDENALGESPDTGATEAETQVFTAGPTWRAVGLEMPTEARADEVLAQAADQCTPVVGDMDNGVFAYTDRSGAVAVFDVVDSKILDVHQDFNATTAVPAQWVEMADRFALVDVVDSIASSGASRGRAFVAMRDGLLQEAGRQAAGELGISALAQRVELYGGTTSYAASETAKIFSEAFEGEKRHPEDTLPTFISTGAVSVMQQQGAHAGAVLAAKIQAAEMHSNTLTGQNFWVLEVDAGFPLSVCVAESDIPARPNPGMVVAGEFLILAARK